MLLIIFSRALCLWSGSEQKVWNYFLSGHPNILNKQERQYPKAGVCVYAKHKIMLDSLVRHNELSFFDGKIAPSNLARGRACIGSGACAIDSKMLISRFFHSSDQQCFFSVLNSVLSLRLGTTLIVTKSCHSY